MRSPSHQHYNSGTNTPNKETSSSSRFYNIGEVMKQDSWQARIRRFQYYDWIKVPKENK